jgi:hypothetical protein
MSSRNLSVSVGAIALLALSPGCQSNDIVGIKPVGSSMEIASTNDPIPALFLRITAIQDPDGLTQLEQVFGETALAQISKQFGDTFVVRMDRRNTGSGLPFRIVVAIYQDKSLQQRMGVFTQEALPGGDPIPVGVHQIADPWDDPGPPDMRDMVVEYSVLGAAAGAGGVSYLWQVQMQPSAASDR